jgi:hypothetical protein
MGSVRLPAGKPQVYRLAGAGAGRMGRRHGWDGIAITTSARPSCAPDQRLGSAAESDVAIFPPFRDCVSVAT